MNGKLKVFSLVAELDASSVYSDFPISKRELSSVLESSRTSIHKWCGLAWATIQDYRSDTPQDDEDGSYTKDAPLTPYQIWLVSRIKLMMGRLRSQDRTRDYMISNPVLFCKGRFDQLHKIIEEKTA